LVATAVLVLATLALVALSQQSQYAAYQVRVEIVKEWIEDLSELGINTTSIQSLLGEAVTLARGGNLTGAIYLLNEAINQSTTLLLRSNVTLNDVRENIEETIQNYNKALVKVNVTPVVSGITKMKINIEHEENTTDVELELIMNNVSEVIKILTAVRDTLVSMNADSSVINSLNQAIALINSTRQGLTNVKISIEDNTTTVEIHSKRHEGGTSINDHNEDQEINMTGEDHEHNMVTEHNATGEHEYHDEHGTSPGVVSNHHSIEDQGLPDADDSIDD